MKVTAVILAAGQGTRMRSMLPKVLHPLGGYPLVEYSLRLAEVITTEPPVVVIGHGADRVRQYVGERARFVIQQPQLGTGHAVQTAESLLSGQTDLVLVISADMPLFTRATLEKLVEGQKQHDGPITMLTMVLADSHGFGRIVRGQGGSVRAIVEEAQASPQQLAITELNVGAYCFQSAWLWDALRRVPLSPKGEYYLTDVVGIAVGDGLDVQAQVVADPREAIGINTRVHLAEAEAILRERINQAWMVSGVTLLDPATTYIEPDVQIGRDSVIYPNTSLRGLTVIGDNCVIGPNTVITASRVENGSEVVNALVERAVVQAGARVGPYQHVREGEVVASLA